MARWQVDCRQEVLLQWVPQDGDQCKALREDGVGLMSEVYLWDSRQIIRPHWQVSVTCLWKIRQRSHGRVGG